MIIKHKPLFHRWYQWLIFLKTLHTITNLLETHHDLQGLEAWASRKRLSKVRQRYAYLLVYVDQQLWRYEFRYKRVLRLVKWTLYIKRQLIGEPKYKKGHAAKYRGM